MEKLSRMHPIFFYNDLQFPGSTMGLTLFEPRYKIMIRRVISADQKFIYLPSFQGYRAEIGQIGFLCTVTSCEFDVQDRASLSMTCHERIIVTNTWVEQGTANLHFAEYDFYNDTGDTAVSDEAKSQFENGLYSDMAQFYRDNIESANLQHHFPSPPDITDLDKAIWWCAKFLNMLRNLPNQKGRDLLRTRSIAERLELLGNIRFRIGGSESSGRRRSSRFWL
jgi:Lon protease-like protein